ncbi:MAG: L-threonylcarbamoyladenylate synthase [Planctomycetota bacterium]|nr:L-threonylcarbamoyladenylate synthase [Planctomycetota bacterium]
MQTRVIRIDAPKGKAGRFEASAVGRQIAPAVRALRAGKLVAFPTETVYGLGAIATDSHAVARLRKVKNRPKSPFTVLISSPDEAKRYVKEIPIPARTLLQKAWPGPVTVLLPVAGKFTHRSSQNRALFRRIAPDGMVGLRCPDHPVAQLLLGRLGKPLLAPSANLAGKSPPRSPEDVLAQLDGRIDMLIDAGGTRYAKASTIVSFRPGGYKVVREGVLDAGAIDRMIRRRILFVCTGNTCRSPIASALAKKMLADHLGCKPGELEKFGQEVLSAGVFTAAGAPATVKAVKAASELGGDAKKHRSKKLTSGLIDSVDLIFCMGRNHLDAVVRQSPAASGKTFLLDETGDIEDPIGGDSQTYLRTAGRIERSLKKRIKENLL